MAPPTLRQHGQPSVSLVTVELRTFLVVKWISKLTIKRSLVTTFWLEQRAVEEAFKIRSNCQFVVLEASSKAEKTGSPRTEGFTQKTSCTWKRQSGPEIPRQEDREVDWTQEPTDDFWNGNMFRNVQMVRPKHLEEYFWCSSGQKANGSGADWQAKGYKVWAWEKIRQKILNSSPVETSVHHGRNDDS